MTRLMIDLPADLEAKLRTRLVGGGFVHSQDYIRDLIEADTNGLEITPPDHLTPQTQNELEKLLVEGLNSGTPIEISAADWNERRRKLAERHSK